MAISRESDAGSAGVDEIEDALAELRSGYALKLPGLLRDLAGALARGRVDPASLGEARRQAHRLQGTAGSYGFVAVGAATKRIEAALLHVEPSTSPVDWDAIDVALAEARAALPA
jgi:chemotaxis protein histidine kinase CheA